MAAAERPVTRSPSTSLWGELRYGGELARLLAREALRAARPRPDAQPVLLIPGFMAGDASLTVLRGWLRRRGHPVRMSGMLANVGCSGRIVSDLEADLRAFAADCARPVFLIGQSRGGALARSLAVRSPDAVSGLVMLGTPVRDPLAISAPVLQTARWLARLGDLGLPGVFSNGCATGDCCASFHDELTAPLDASIAAFAVHSRSDAIVDWRACLDPHARPVEVDSSHCGMSVHPAVYTMLERALQAPAEFARAG